MPTRELDLGCNYVIISVVVTHVNVGISKFEPVLFTSSHDVIKAITCVLITNTGKSFLLLIGLLAML